MRELVCIVCPRGCTMQVEKDGEEIKVSGNSCKRGDSGNSCKRGEQFAKSELTNPTRTICTTVRTTFKDAPVLPVRVSAEIPKNRIFDVMREINKVKVDTRVGRGDVIIENVVGLGADIIATSDLLREAKA